MALESKTLRRRMLGPTIASAVVGLVMGIVAVIGSASIANKDSAPTGNAVTSDDAVLGNPEYGSRQG